VVMCAASHRSGGYGAKQMMSLRGPTRTPVAANHTCVSPDVPAQGFPHGRGSCPMPLPSGEMVSSSHRARQLVRRHHAGVRVCRPGRSPGVPFPRRTLSGREMPAYRCSALCTNCMHMPAYGARRPPAITGCLPSSHAGLHWCWRRRALPASAGTSVHQSPRAHTAGAECHAPMARLQTP
jgi:hypothetical protein